MPNLGHEKLISYYPPNSVLPALDPHFWIKARVEEGPLPLGAVEEDSQVEKEPPVDEDEGDGLIFDSESDEEDLMRRWVGGLHRRVTWGKRRGREELGGKDVERAGTKEEGRLRRSIQKRENKMMEKIKKKGSGFEMK